MAKKINITAQLNAATTDGILADAGQIFDTKKGKFQEQVNEEFEDALEEAITSEDTDMVVESIEEGIIHNALRKTEQILTEAEKGQARENIGAVSEQTFENEAVRVKKQVFTSEQKYQARHNISAITAEEAEKIAQDKINETSVSSPDKLQAVKELSSWLEDNPESAATMNAAIQDNAADIQRLYRGTGIDEYSEFSSLTDYAAGAVVLYDGVLFRFKVDHAAGAWDYNEVEEWSEKKEREEKVGELEREVNGRVAIKPGVNLFDKSDKSVLEGAYISGNVILPSPDYNSSGYIKVEPNTTYYPAKDALLTYRFVNFYDRDKNYLSFVESSNLTMQEFTTPNDAYYVRITFASGNDYSKAQVSLAYTEYTPYTPVGGYLSAYEEDLQKNRIDRIITISNAIFAGASLKDYAIEGAYYNEYGNFAIGSDMRYSAIPLIKTKKVFYINNAEWRVESMSARCFNEKFELIGTIGRVNDGTNSTMTPIEGTAYLGLYWTVAAENISNKNLDNIKLHGLINKAIDESFENSANNNNRIRTLCNTVCFVQRNRLLDNVPFEKGYLNEINGHILPSDIYTTSDFVSFVMPQVYSKGLRKLVWYDVNKKYISGEDIVDPVGNHVHVRPIDAVYVRASFYASGIQYTLTAIDSGEDVTFLLQNGKIIEEIKEATGEPSGPSLELPIYLESENLFNPNDSDVLLGYYVNGSEVRESDAYNTSGYIEVLPNTTYYPSSNAERGFRFVNFYDENRSLISSVADGTNTGIQYFDTPSNCRFVRVVFYSAFYNKAQVSQYRTTYVSYEDKSLKTDAKVGYSPNSIPTIKDVGNPLFGKKWAVCGDSFSAGFSSDKPSNWFIEKGAYQGLPKVYGYLIANRNNMTLQWMSVGGRTIATPADGSFSNAFSNSENTSVNSNYTQIDNDVDYITLYFGINDSHHAPGSTGDDGEDMSGSIPLGTIDDTTRDTFYGAWNVVIPYLLENYPFAHIGIIVSNGCDTPEYRVAEIAIAKKYGIPYIDLNGDERTPFMIRSQNTDIPQNIRELRTKIQAVDYDGTTFGAVDRHPNKDAHEFQSVFIENWLKSI